MKQSPLTKRLLENRNKLVNLFKLTIRSAFYEDFVWNSEFEISEAKAKLIELIKDLNIEDILETTAYNDAE